MRKKLGNFLLIVFLMAIAIGILNIENICKKYIYPIEYGSYIEKAAYETGIDKYLIYAVIKTESNLLSVFVFYLRASIARLILIVLSV